jgi:60 kDa SS-A/Ro ribonucleoprotein
MSFFNKIKTILTKTTTNKVGGLSYSMTPELEIALLLTTSKIDNKFYENTDERVIRLKDLIIKNKDKPGFVEFVAKSIVYSRKVVGMRTVSHIATALLTEHTSGQKWAKNFYFQTINRLDDISETIAAYNHFYRVNKNIGSLPKAMFKGFSKSLSGMNYYSASKYQMKNKQISLIDLVNLLHVKTEWTDELMKNGKLKPAETKEVKLSNAGQIAKSQNMTDEQKQELKASTIEEMLDVTGMPYKALIMHLVKIANQTNPTVIEKACDAIRNPQAISKSLIHPLELLVAYQQIITKTQCQEIVLALSDAIELCYKLPTIEQANLEGKTCVMLDISGSMSGIPMKIGGLCAAILLKLGNAHLIRYDDKASKMMVNINDSVFSIQAQISDAQSGTNIFTAFDLIQKTSYDRIVVITDQQDFGKDNMQGNSCFTSWKAKNNPLAHIYSIDIAGYGQSIAKSSDMFVHTFCGFDRSVVEQITNNRTDLVAIINETIKFDS